MIEKQFTNFWLECIFNLCTHAQIVHSAFVCNIIVAGDVNCIRDNTKKSIQHTVYYKYSLYVLLFRCEKSFMRSISFHSSNVSFNFVARTHVHFSIQTHFSYKHINHPFGSKQYISMRQSLQWHKTYIYIHTVYAHFCTQLVYIAFVLFAKHRNRNECDGFMLYQQVFVHQYQSEMIHWMVVLYKTVNINCTVPIVRCHPNREHFRTVCAHNFHQIYVFTVFRSIEKTSLQNETIHSCFTDQV